jgi:hypothetical protein
LALILVIRLDGEATERTRVAVARTSPKLKRQRDRFRLLDWCHKLNSSASKVQSRPLDMHAWFHSATNLHLRASWYQEKNNPKRLSSCKHVVTLVEGTQNLLSQQHEGKKYTCCRRFRSHPQRSLMRKTCVCASKSRHLNVHQHIHTYIHIYYIYGKQMAETVRKAQLKQPRERSIQHHPSSRHQGWAKWERKVTCNPF